MEMISKISESNLKKDLKVHDRVIILFATNLILCGHTTSALKVLEEIGIKYLKANLAEGNVNKLLAYLHLCEEDQTLENILTLCIKAQNAFRNANSILGYTSAILMKFHILLKILHNRMNDEFYENDDNEDVNVEQQKITKLFSKCKSKLVL